MKNRQTTALILSAAMVLSASPVYAENTKHERVYAVTDPTGAVQTLVDNIRLDNKDSLDEIEDVSLLKDIENVGGMEEFVQDGEKITWKASGSDITYQGTSDKALPVVPVVHVTVDGSDKSGEELKDLSGNVTLEITYETSDDTCALAASVIPLPSEGITDLSLTNAMLIDENGIQCIAGWGVTGADESEKLTDSFSADFTADHADFSWMYTVCSSEPLAALHELAADNSDMDLSLEIDEAASILQALSEGTEIPETTGKTKDTGARLNELNQGLQDLDDGASRLSEGSGSLSEGAVSASEGAAKLSEGLSTLTANNQSLTDGISALFDAVLATANEQLASSALASSGMTIPELTQENYSEELDKLLAQLSPENVEAAVKEQIRAKVEENRSQVEAAVDEEVKKQIIEAALKALNQDMTVDQYNEALDAGTLDPVVSSTVQLALTAQLNSKDVKAKRDAAVEEQIESLVESHTQEFLASDEGKEKTASALQGYDSLNALKAQLSQVQQLADGVVQYTDGVAAASDGAAELSEGLGTLSDGAASLASGAQELSEGMAKLHTSLTDAEKEAADTILPYVEGSAAQILETMSRAAGDNENGSYDLRSDNMKTVTIFIIRTDF